MSAATARPAAERLGWAFARAPWRRLADASGLGWTAEANPATRESYHATCVRWLRRGLLLTGPSGSGKSELAARLVAEGARLVADDLVVVGRERGWPVARAAALPGLLELRGFGLVQLRPLAATRLDAVVRLRPAAGMERLPDPDTVTIAGHRLPVVPLDPSSPAATARLRLALTRPRLVP